MLVVVGPPFEGSDADYGRLASATGLVVYDLKAKLKPGYWGVVRALGDVQAAAALAANVASLGHRVAVVDPQVGHDEERRFVPLLGIDLTADGCVLRLRGRDMEVPLTALLTLVRGEVQVGTKTAARSSASSTSLRAVTASGGDLAAFRESLAPPPIDAFAAADLHFVTVPWVARIDARNFQFPPELSARASLSGVESPALALDALCDRLAELGGFRVDRGAKLSSLLSFTQRPSIARVQTPNPGGPASMRPSSPPASDERFDAYSRLVGEAERRAPLPRG